MCAALLSRSLLLALAVCAGPAAAADFGGWGRLMRITFSGYARPEPLTNFPALVLLGANIPGFRYSDFLSGSNADLRFADAGLSNALDYEIETWDTNGISCVWVRVPRLEGTNTAVWALWGKPGVSAPECTTNGAVWSNGYGAVLHMAGTNTFDSSPYRHAVTNWGATNAPGICGPALGFSGSSSLRMGDVVNPSSITLSAWIRWNSAVGDGTYNCPVGKVNSYELVITRGTRVLWWAHSRNWAINNTTFLVTPGQWAHLVLAYDQNSGTRVYANAEQVGSASTTGPLVCAGMLGAGVRGDGWGYWGGVIDELHISTVPRGSNWVWACYMNTASNAAFCRLDPIVTGTVVVVR